MTIKQRHYTSEPGFTEDYLKVKEFLKRIYEPGYKYGNWLWNRWEWGFSLPYLDETQLARIGVWESDGEIVALATYEQELGDVWISLDPRYHGLKKEILEYTFEYLSKTDENGIRSVNVNIDGADREFKNIALDLGYKSTNNMGQPPVEALPAGRQISQGSAQYWRWGPQEVAYGWRLQA